MSLDLFWLIKRNPDNEESRIWYQSNADDVSFSAISPGTNLVIKLLHDAHRNTLDRTIFWVGLKITWRILVPTFCTLLQKRLTRGRLLKLQIVSFQKPNKDLMQLVPDPKGKNWDEILNFDTFSPENCMRPMFNNGAWVNQSLTEFSKSNTGLILVCQQ